MHGVPNTRPGGQNWLAKDSNVGNVKEDRTLKLLPVFSCVLQLVLMISTSLMAIHTLK